MRIDFAKKKKKLWLLNFFFTNLWHDFPYSVVFLSNKIKPDFRVFYTIHRATSWQQFHNNHLLHWNIFDIHNLKTNLKKTEHETGNGGFFRYIIHIFRGEKRFGFWIYIYFTIELLFIKGGIPRAVSLLSLIHL